MEDERIIELFNERSELAIMNAQMKYGRYLEKIANNILGDKEDSEECVNDAYLNVWKSIPPEKPSCLKTYLGKITRNLSLDRYEKNTAIKRGGGEVKLALDELTEVIPGDGIEKTIDSTEIAKAINEFLSSETLENRNIFVRRYWYLDSILEIAKLYHLSEAKVKTSLFRMREKLKERFSSEGIEI